MNNENTENNGKKKKDPWRPITVTEDIKVKVLESINAGMTDKDSRDLAGVTRWSVKRAMERDPTFAHLVTQARLGRKRELIRRLYDGAESDWRAAITYLERRYPDEWSKRDPESYEPIDMLEIANEVADKAKEFIPTLEGRQAFREWYRGYIGQTRKKRKDRKRGR